MLKLVLSPVGYGEECMDVVIDHLLCVSRPWMLTERCYRRWGKQPRRNTAVDKVRTEPQEGGDGNGCMRGVLAAGQVDHRGECGSQGCLQLGVVGAAGGNRSRLRCV